jgi:hypothetical protein
VTVDAAAFKRVLDIGLGRAILFLRTHDARPYRDAILHACLHNTAYDPQVEGSRAVYLREVLALSGDEAAYREAILTALADSGRGWDAEQLFKLAATYADEGDRRARQVLYAKYTENARAGGDTGETAIVSLDGLDGLLYVVRLAHEDGQITGEEGLHGYEWLLSAIEEADGKEETRRVLLRAAQAEPWISTFLAGVDAYRAEERSPTSVQDRYHAIPYAMVKQAISEGRTRVAGRSVRVTDEQGQMQSLSLWMWGRHASDEQLARAATDLLAETDARRLVPLLWIFWRRRFPFGHSPLLALARHQDQGVALGALAVLRNTPDLSVRTLALDLLQDAAMNDERKAEAVDLLVQNHEDGDFSILDAALAGITGRDAFHSFGLGVLAVFAKHPSSEAFDTLTLLYERGPCSHCRRNCVAGLLQLGTLPKWMHEECRYDANLDIRDLADE